jgi:ElaB/YqjD/DUF883 family membrane-anchored ribosome-binding protein
MTTETKRLVNDLKIIGRDTEDLIKATAGDLSEKASAARSRLTTAVECAKDSCLALQDKALLGVRTTDKLVRENPYKTLGIVVGLGLLVGFFINRATRD